MGVMIGLEFQDHLLQPSAFLLRTRTTYFSAADKHGESAKRGVSKPGKGERQGRTRGKILDAAMPSPAGSRRGAFLLWILRVADHFALHVAVPRRVVPLAFHARPILQLVLHRAAHARNRGQLTKQGRDAGWAVPYSGSTGSFTSSFASSHATVKNVGPLLPTSTGRVGKCGLR